MRYRFHYRGCRYGKHGWREIDLDTGRRIKALFAELRQETLQELVRSSCEWKRRNPSSRGSMWFYIHHVYVRELKEYLCMGDDGISALENELRKKSERIRKRDAVEPYLPKSSENREYEAIDGLSCTGRDALAAFGRKMP